jgi:hypothetical protein
MMRTAKPAACNVQAQRPRSGRARNDDVSHAKRDRLREIEDELYRLARIPVGTWDYSRLEREEKLGAEADILRADLGIPDPHAGRPVRQSTRGGWIAFFVLVPAAVLLTAAIAVLGD